MNKPIVGKPAPKFTATLEDGSEISLSEFSGKKLALYFYPKDETPTCTDQACNIRDNFADLLANNIHVVGVSADDAKSHTKFIAKHNLNFSLIADVDHTLLNMYGVWGPKKFMGKEFDGIHRTTFLIDENGVLVDIIEKVKAKEHNQQIKKGFEI
ncbi:MAG: thioredoxin-dependent thiol peroxidase [Cryomorphaceae bacterium]|nr:thioredoxin-dependent thiol peroxidase [Cryomorphaceae bacterium]